MSRVRCKPLIEVVLLAVAVYAIVCGAAWWLQDRLVYFPSRTVAWTPAAAGLDYPQDASPEGLTCDPVAESCQPKTFAGGATVGDYNGDGCPDLFVTRLGGRPLLFENTCAGAFVEVGAAVGIDATVDTNGAIFADLDNDGDLDLYVTTQDADANLHQRRRAGGLRAASPALSGGGARPRRGRPTGGRRPP